MTNDNQYALISFIVSGLAAKKKSPPGKKAMQKLVHILEEGIGVQTGYEFSFYTYGPFSEELADDLSVVEAMGSISISYDKGNNAYSIVPTENALKSLTTKQKKYVESNSKKINSVLNYFGGRTAKELELFSTIIFLRNRKKHYDLTNDRTLVDKVKEFKPKYSLDEIRMAVKELSSKIN